MSDIEKSRFVLNLDTSHLPIDGAATAEYVAKQLRRVADQVEAEPSWLGMFRDIKHKVRGCDYPAGQFANKPEWYLKDRGA